MGSGIKILAVAAALASAPAVQAVVVGDSVSCAVTGVGTFSCSAGPAVVGAGPEFQIGNLPASPFITADFSTGELLLTGLRRGNLGSTILNFENLTTPFTMFSDLGSSGWNGYSFLDDVSLAGGVLTINLIGTNFGQGPPSGWASARRA